MSKFEQTAQSIHASGNCAFKRAAADATWASMLLGGVSFYIRLHSASRMTWRRESLAISGGFWFLRKSGSLCCARC